MQKKSGVNIDLGNKSSKIAYDYAIETFRNRNGKRGAVASKSKGGFSNLLIFGKERIGIGSDGIGTKAELAERTGIYDTLGYDLVAMVADDLAAMGFEPTNLSNIIDVDYLETEIIDALMKGLRDACNFSGITITGGEIAELGERISGFGEKMHFNWSSTAIGILPENLKDAVDGSNIKSGQLIFTLKSRGFRSNGFSSIRRILNEHFGDNWHNEKYDENTTWGKKMLTPSLIYAPLINEIIASGSELTGVVHITGGGVFDNLRRALKLNNVGAELNNLYEPLPEMTKIQQIGDVPDKDAYRWWNMGNGMLIIADKKDADTILQKADQLNYECRIAGSITAGSNIQVEFPTFKMHKEY
ncbi:MAG: phosphoribosylformylglycinamidine cyclo-ligase [Bacteroidetes bacterium]|nr:MAG: phosphoribosylformylglycinamidine cyclo-ligase [Bacteroidota bacterium]